ncbi:hypothetical protein [Streptomyces neyagawaensis]|uniref:hypothetical protein n=1 Tax=Streptomyces neyagawaensis TaxID=42238 RepID=UPI001981F268|nr:hypothetical protein [Streptomyces neyagawaensis]MCL6737235.1 hypothetical protein [Streptomyces neyagawaensis]MDE1687455.1 hypothetical protein [Streptomyces neyagawaensis]
MPGAPGGDGGVASLEGHGPVDEPERFEGVVVRGQDVDAESHAVAHVLGLVDGRFGSCAQVVGEGPRLPPLSLEPGAVAVGERGQGGAQFRAACGYGEGRELVHAEFQPGQQRLFVDLGGGGGAYVILGQPCGGQPVSPPLAVADVGRHGDVAADAVAEAVAVEEAQPPLLRFLGGPDGPGVQRVVDGQEDGRPVVGERGHLQAGLELPLGPCGRTCSREAC